MFEVPAFTLVSSNNISRGIAIAGPVTAIVFTSINNIPGQSSDSWCWFHLKWVYISSAVGAFSVKVIQDQQWSIFQLIHFPHVSKTY